MSDQRAQQLIQQFQILEQYAGDLSQRESTLIGILQETQHALETVRALGDKDDFETLAPVGMGTFIKARISSKDKIALNVGAGAVIEKDRDYVLNFLEEKIKEIQVALQETSAKRQETLRRLEQGKHEMNRLLRADAPPSG